MEKLMIPADRNPEFVAELGFDPAFTLTLAYDGPHVEQTPHGGRMLSRIVGGKISGKIDGSVYPNGGGEYSLRRKDGVIDISAHIMLRDDAGEWLYIHNIGYRRPDGYYRVTSWVDADVRGTHNWVAGLFFIGIGKPDDNGGMTINYFEVL